jgi:hypothetical protein
MMDRGISAKFGGTHQLLRFCQECDRSSAAANRTVAAARPCTSLFAYGKYCERRREATCPVDMRSMPPKDFFRRNTNDEKSSDAVSRGLSPARLTWSTAELTPNQHISLRPWKTTTRS